MPSAKDWLIIRLKCLNKMSMLSIRIVTEIFVEPKAFPLR